MTHPSLYERRIIHFDMDAFYASVEIRDNPELSGLPVVIGGSPNSRGVVCTASYEARKFGIRSAMPCSQAYRKCPKAVFLRPDFKKYKKESEAIRNIFKDYTPKIEPLSLDEAYLDVTHDEENRFASQVAREIQRRIYDELKLTGSAGVAPNKMVAKIASDHRKPFGITVIKPEEVVDFISPLSLRKIPGIGPVSQKKLEKHGLVTCYDALSRGEEALIATLGQRFGKFLFRASQGLDFREVQQSWKRKSLGKETTFSQDIIDRNEIMLKIADVKEGLSRYLESNPMQFQSITVKVKYSDFKSVTRTTTLPDPRTELKDLDPVIESLMDKTEVGARPVRLVGLSLGKLVAMPTSA